MTTARLGVLERTKKFQVIKRAGCRYHYITSLFLHPLSSNIIKYHRIMSNKNSTSLRRIRADLRELTMDKNSNDRYTAAPLEHDMFEWHFTIRGPVTTDYENGIYHGRILLPPDYPYKPPHIIFLTPNGRFDTNTKICLSFSAYHPELWQPAWGIRLILEALIAFLPTPTDGAIGAIDYSSTERKKLAVQSQQFFCSTCQCYPRTLLRSVPQKSDDGKETPTADSSTSQPVSSATLRFQKEIEELQRLQFLEHSKKEESVVREAEVKSDVIATTTNHYELATMMKVMDGDNQQQQQREQTSGAEKIGLPTNDAHKEDVVTDPPLPKASNDTPPPTSHLTPNSTTQKKVMTTSAAAGATTTTSTMMDHILNGSMILFAIVCAILLRNIQVLLLEIRDLSSSS
jgi:ubiquitin-conjugating enzyme E2 J1